MDVTRLHHDTMCPSCKDTTCTTCECLCDFIADIREDERAAIARVLPIINRA